MASARSITFTHDHIRRHMDCLGEILAEAERVGMIDKAVASTRLLESTLWEIRHLQDLVPDGWELRPIIKPKKKPEIEIEETV